MLGTNFLVRSLGVCRGVSRVLGSTTRLVAYLDTQSPLSFHARFSSTSMCPSSHWLRSSFPSHYLLYVPLSATSTGTTIVGLKFGGGPNGEEEGICLGADTRATGGPIVADKNCEKVSHRAFKLILHLWGVRLNKGLRPCITWPTNELTIVDSLPHAWYPMLWCRYSGRY